MSGQHRSLGRALLDSPSYALTPWEEESKIPQMYLNSTITPSSRHKHNTFAPSLTKLRDFHPRKIEKRAYTLKSQPLLNGNKNLGYLQCIQFSWIDPKIPINASDKQKEKKVIVARRRSRNGLEIKSIKKKIVDSSLLAERHPFFQATSLKQRVRFITESKLNTSVLIPASPPSQGSFIPKTKHKRGNKGLTSHLSREFLNQISTIATISTQKRHGEKCKTEAHTNIKDWMMQRDLFLQTNTKFKDWQRGTCKTISTGISLPIGIS